MKTLVNPSLHRYTAQFYRGNKLNFAGAMLARVIEAFAGLYIAWLLQSMLDMMMGGGGHTLTGMALHMAAMLALLLLATAIECWAKPRFLERAMRQYKDFAFQELTKKSISSFSAERTSVYISALSNDTNSIEINYLEKLFELVEKVLMFFGALALMFWYSPTLTLIAIAMGFVPVVASVLSGNRLSEAEKHVSERNEMYMASLKDSLTGFSVVKSFRAENEICGLMEQENKFAESAKCRSRRINTIIKGMGSLAGALAQFGVFFAGVLLSLRGKSITPGIVVAFVQLMNYVINPIAFVPQALAGRKASLALIDKLAEALSSNIRDEGESVPQRLDDAIELSDVSFSYTGGAPVLRGVSARFEAGKSYAIVGASGCGKSTLLNILMGGSSEYQGSVCYDGVDLRNISSSSLYELVSLIQQNVFVFNNTILSNVTMFKDFAPEDIERAICFSGLSELVHDHGEDYLCGENGCGLSGGERQRVSIARSLLRKTPVILVDEATAALDAKTAYQVSSSILDLKGVTRIVVTHALNEALLRRYDGILVMKDGMVIETGKFDALMERKGYFYSLYTVSQ